MNNLVVMCILLVTSFLGTWSIVFTIKNWFSVLFKPKFLIGVFIFGVFNLAITILLSIFWFRI